MARPSILESLKQRVLLADGAMGTQLHLAGLEPGQCGELWNTDRPGEILAIQKRYAAAGSDCLITNTFGASPLALGKYGLAGKTRETNKAGARIAREALGPDGYVLGDIGPLGEMLAPLGPISEVEAVRCFREQAAALIAGGVDAIIIETMMSLDELLAAVRAVRLVNAQIPVIASMAFDNLASGGYATMMGTRPADLARVASEAGADIIASNCGTSLGVNDHAQIVAEFHRSCDKPLMAQPNAGKPEVKGGKVVYHETPERMAAAVPELIKAGARIIGGCCGTTPDHIAAFRKVIDAL